MRPCYADESHSPNSHHERSPGSLSKSPFSLKSFSKSSAVADMDTDVKSSFSRKSNLAGSSATLQVEGSSGSKSALPPVQVNGSFTQQAPRAPAAIAAMISPTNTGAFGEQGFT
jgi:hypothetical protein